MDALKNDNLFPSDSLFRDLTAESNFDAEEALNITGLSSLINISNTSLNNIKDNGDPSMLRQADAGDFDFSMSLEQSEGPITPGYYAIIQDQNRLIKNANPVTKLTVSSSLPVTPQNLDKYPIVEHGSSSVPRTRSCLGNASLSNPIQKKQLTYSSSESVQSNKDTKIIPKEKLSSNQLHDLENLWNDIQKAKQKTEEDIRLSLENLNHLREVEKPITVRKISKEGENINTVPNLGAGIVNSEISLNPPITEPLCVQRKAFTVGAGDPEDDDTLHNIDSIKENAGYQSENIASSNEVVIAEKSDPVSYKLTDATKSYFVGGTLGSIPDLGFGIRDLPRDLPTSQTGESRHVTPAAALKKKVDFVLDDKHEERLGKSSLQQSQTKESHMQQNAYSDALTKSLKNLENIVSTDTGLCSLSKQDLMSDFSFPSFPSSIDTDHVSLSSLWNTPRLSNTPREMQQRLLEEQLRRQTCEKMIQQLQLRLLEEQQRLAVAVEIDRKKDDSINQLEKAWSQLVNQWKVQEIEMKKEVEQERREKEELEKKFVELAEKSQKYEQELIKALDLADNFKNKLVTSDLEANHKIEMQKSEIKLLTDKIQNEEHQVIRAMSDKGQIVLDMNKMETDFRRCKADLEKANGNIREAGEKLREHSSKYIEAENKISSFQKQTGHLESKLSNQSHTIAHLQEQMKELNKKLTDSKNKEEKLSNESNSYPAKVEKLRTDLHTFYQNNVEKILAQKLAKLELDRAKVEEVKEENREQEKMDVKKKHEDDLRQTRSIYTREFENVKKEYRDDISQYQNQIDQTLECLYHVIVQVNTFQIQHTSLTTQLQSEVVEHLGDKLQKSFLELIKNKCQSHQENEFPEPQRGVEIRSAFSLLLPKENIKEPIPETVRQNVQKPIYVDTQMTQTYDNEVGSSKRYMPLEAKYDHYMQQSENYRVKFNDDNNKHQKLKDESTQCMPIPNAIRREVITTGTQINENSFQGVQSSNRVGRGILTETGNQLDNYVSCDQPKSTDCDDEPLGDSTAEERQSELLNYIRQLLEKQTTVAMKKRPKKKSGRVSPHSDGEINPWNAASKHGKGILVSCDWMVIN